jgi:hypothetical protein
MESCHPPAAALGQVTLFLDNPQPKAEQGKGPRTWLFLSNLGL